MKSDERNGLVEFCTEEHLRSLRKRRKDPTVTPEQKPERPEDFLLQPKVVRLAGSCLALPELSHPPTCVDLWVCVYWCSFAPAHPSTNPSFFPLGG